MSETSQDTESTEQPLVSHLVELRDRLLRCLIVVLVIFLGLYAFADEIYTFVAAPLEAVLPEGGQMIATSVTSTFFAPLKLTLVAAVFLAIPFLLHQIWAFVAPGLYQNEVKIAFPILVSSIFLFYLGVAFAYFVVFQYMFAFFIGVSPENVTVMTDIKSYLDFILVIFFAFGLTFEIPIATVLLIFSGATTPKKLAEKRPYIIIAFFIVAIPLTPADPLTQSMLAIPMCLLFELGILAGRILHKPSEDEDETEADAKDSEENKA